MLRFSFKLGLAAGATYYLSEQGVWKSSKETTQLYCKIGENLSPYVKQVKGQLPIEMPHLPSTNKVSYLTKQYWNKGVTETFIFLGNLPQNMTVWTRKGVEATMGNSDVKKFIASLSGTPTTNE